MGQFSWLDCKTGEQVIDNHPRDVYLLVPRQLGGGHIKETCYDGYGHFDGKDVYDLVADWNRDYIPVVLDHLLDVWKCSIDEKTKRDLSLFAEEKEPSCEKRWLGIVLACYDEDNARLKYPIKITHDPDAVYETCTPSKSDPNQGWPPDSDYDDSDWDNGYFDEMGFNPYTGSYDYDC